MSKLIDRMVRAAKLDPTLYEEIVNDPTSQAHSIYVVVLFAIAAGFGTFSRGGATAVNICTITTLIAWYVWAFTVYYIGTRFFREPETRVDRKAVMRVMAFACAPGILRLLGLFPSITGIVFIVTSIWVLVAAVVGVKQALNFSSTSRAAGLCILTWIAATFFQGILLVIIFSAFKISSPYP
jgi:hypothetical protein